MNEEAKIELRSEEFQEVLGTVPPWILRWGILILAVFTVILLIGSAVFKYPDIISARVTLTGTQPPAAVVARSSGKLKELFVADNQEVKTGEYLAVIDNPARTEDVLELKDYLANKPVKFSKLNRFELQLGSLQTLYSSFYTTLFEYTEYQRLSYYPQKIQMTKQRITQYEAQYQNLLRQQRIVNEQFVLAGKQFQRDSLLHQKGLIANEEYEKSQNAYLQSEMSREHMHSSVNNMKIQIEQLKELLLDTGEQDIEKSNSLQTQLQSLVSQLKTEIQAWELSYVLQSPIDGKITFNGFWTVNQNVNAGEVPSQTGQTVNYTVEIDLPEGLNTTYKKELPYLQNMQGKAEIITEDISLLERFVLPIKKILKESV